MSIFSRGACSLFVAQLGKWLSSLHCTCQKIATKWHQEVAVFGTLQRNNTVRAKVLVNHFISGKINNCAQ